MALKYGNLPMEQDTKLVEKEESIRGKDSEMSERRLRRNLQKADTSILRILATFDEFKFERHGPTDSRILFDPSGAAGPKVEVMGETVEDAWEQLVEHTSGRTGDLSELHLLMKKAEQKSVTNGTKSLDLRTENWDFDKSDKSSSETEGPGDAQDPHEFEIHRDAIEFEEDVDLETRMYQLSKQTHNGMQTAEVMNYIHHEKTDEIVVLCKLPDESIGRLQYDVPEEAGSDFAEMLSVARAKFEDGDREVTLENLELLDNADVPVYEHGDGWLIDTSKKFIEPDPYQSELLYSWLNRKTVSAQVAIVLIVGAPMLLIDLFTESDYTRIQDGFTPETVITSILGAMLWVGTLMLLEVEGLTSVIPFV